MCSALQSRTSTRVPSADRAASLSQQQDLPKPACPPSCLANRRVAIYIVLLRCICVPYPKCFIGKFTIYRSLPQVLRRLTGLFSANLRRIIPQAMSRRLWRPRHNIKKNCGTEALLHCFCAAVVIANCRCQYAYFITLIILPSLPRTMLIPFCIVLS